jgi:Rap1a immunity proteins
MLDQALRHDLGHDLVGVVNTLPALVSKRKGKRSGQVGRVGGRELVGVGHCQTIAEVRERNKNMRGAIVLVAMLLTGAASAQSPDISAQRLLSSWKGEDPMMSKLAEVIAAAFSSGLSWQGALGGKQVYCPPPGLKGGEAMSAFERFLADHPEMAERPYGDTMAAMLSRTFPCRGL